MAPWWARPFYPGPDARWRRNARQPSRATVLFGWQAPLDCFDFGRHTRWNFITCHIIWYRVMSESKHLTIVCQLSKIFRYWVLLHTRTSTVKHQLQISNHEIRSQQTQELNRWQISSIQRILNIKMNVNFEENVLGSYYYFSELGDKHILAVNKHIFKTYSYMSMRQT